MKSDDEAYFISHCGGGGGGRQVQDLAERQRHASLIQGSRPNDSF